MFLIRRNYQLLANIESSKLKAKRSKRFLHCCSRVLRLKKINVDTNRRSTPFAYLNSRASSDSTREERLSQYGFWRERYKNVKNSTTFDWFLDSSLLLENIDIHLGALYKNTPNSILRYLELGCGNSELPLSVYRESPIPVFVLAMDYVTYAAQQQSYQAMNICPKNNESQFQAVCGDVMKLPFKSQLIDIAVDKGTMDALLKNKEKGLVNSCVMLSEIMRALATGGRYVQISDEDPDSRLDFLHKVTRYSECLLHNNDSNNTTMDNNLLGNCDNYSNNIASSKESDKDSENNPYRFQDIRKEVKMDIIQSKICKSSKPLSTNQNNLISNSWRFKVIADEGCNREYFMYWTERT